MKTEEKHKPKLLSVVNNPILIVGQNPGTRKDGTSTGIVWEENKSAQLLHEIIEDRENIYLTNICNYTDCTPPRIIEGRKDIVNIIKEYGPYKIICLGVLAYVNIKMIVRKLNLDIKVISFQHPSYILRFKRGTKSEYIGTFRKALDE